MNRFYSKFCFPLAAFCFFINLNLKAQEKTFTPEHLKAAKEFVDAIDAKPRFQNGIAALVKSQAAKVSEDKRAIYEGVMHNFINKYFPWDVVCDRISKVYAEGFTIEELQQLAAFYKSPVSKKYLSKRDEIFQKSEQIGHQIAFAHQEELKSMMQTAFSKK